MGLMGWFGKSFGGDPHRGGDAGGAAGGIYRIHGDYRPLLPTLADLKKRVEAEKVGSESKLRMEREYNEVLKAITQMLIRPLPSDYELSDAVMDIDYVELKRIWQKDGPLTFSRFLASPGSENIALVKVVSGAQRRRMKIEIEVLDVFRGSFVSKEVSVCSVSGFGEKWFLAGETCLIFCDNTETSCGPLGRMPLLEGGREGVIESFIYPEFWNGFKSVVFSDGVSSVNWSEVSFFLRSREF